MVNLNPHHPHHQEGSTEGGVGDGGLDQSEQAKKVRKEVYKLLIVAVWVVSEQSVL